MNDETKAKVTIEWENADCRSALLSVQSWDELSLSKELMQGIYGAGFSKPSGIQAAALPVICPPASKNLIGQAASGSGKTATFALGMLSNIDCKVNKPQALIIAPTRELAIQTEEVVSVLGKYVGVTVLKLLPGHERLEKGSATQHVVVGTPGKVNT